MAFTIDLNCDMGEGMGNEAAIMPYISSASIACSYHAGDENSIRTTIRIAQQWGVSIGAHPSFKDKENFGRILHPMDTTSIYQLVTMQLELFRKIADEEKASIRHVKPHGALYNWSASDKTAADAIAKAVKDFDSNLSLFGLSGSHSIKAGLSIGLQTVSEVFADRTYQPDGSLTSRSQPGAIIKDHVAMEQQVLQMIQQEKVTCTDGSSIPIMAETICLHGDNPDAAATVKKLYTTIQMHQIAIRPKQ